MNKPNEYAEKKCYICGGVMSVFNKSKTCSSICDKLYKNPEKRQIAIAEAMERTIKRYIRIEIHSKISGALSEFCDFMIKEKKLKITRGIIAKYLEKRLSIFAKEKKINFSTPQKDFLNIEDWDQEKTKESRQADQAKKYSP